MLNLLILPNLIPLVMRDFRLLRRSEFSKSHCPFHHDSFGILFFFYTVASGLGLGLDLCLVFLRYAIFLRFIDIHLGIWLRRYRFRFPLYCPGLFNLSFIGGGGGGGGIFDGFSGW